MSTFPEFLTADDREKLQKTSQPSWHEPMLATLVHEYFDDAQWIYERKLDGQRCIAFQKDGEVKIYSRNHNSLNERYPELLDGLTIASPKDFVVDGEIVAMDGKFSSFSKLQPRMQASNPDLSVPVKFYLFDILHFDGYDLTSLPLRSRKVVLKRMLQFEDPLRFTPHRNKTGKAYLQEAKSKGWEGLIAKDARSDYTPTRSRRWLKFKCENRQEFVVGGFTEPHGARSGFGALLLGFHRAGKLRFAGKVGTGFNDPFLVDLRERLDRREVADSPFTNPPRDSRGVHWVRPDLVAEVSFTEWTSGDKLRHPAFVGLRTDKPPQKVVKE